MGVEIARLASQVDSLAKEQSTYIAYESRVKEKAVELQGEIVTLIYSKIIVNTHNYVCKS